MMNGKKRRAVRLTCLVLLLAVGMLLFAGCMDTKAEEQYRSDVTQLMGQIAEASNVLNQKVTAFSASLSEEDRQAVQTAVSNLDDTFAAFSQLKAPKKYTQQQSALEEAASTARQGTEIYRTEFRAVTSGTFNDAFAELIAKGDGLVKQGTEGLEAAARIVNGDAAK